MPAKHCSRVSDLMWFCCELRSGATQTQKFVIKGQSRLLKYK